MIEKIDTMPHTGSPERREQSGASFEVQALIDEIDSIEARVSQELGLLVHSPEAVEATDEFLVHAAEKNIAEDCSYPDTESGRAVMEGVEAVAIESALEITGEKTSAGELPVVVLELDGHVREVTDVVEELHRLHSVMPNGEKAASIIAEEIDNFHNLHDLTGNVVLFPSARLGIGSSWQQKSEAAKKVTIGLRGIQGQEGTTIGEIGYQKGYRVDKIPVALPIASRSTLSELDDPLRYRAWKDMADDEKFTHGNYFDHDKDMAFDNLTAEAKHTILTDRIFVLEAKSNDPGEQSKAVQASLDRLARNEVICDGDYVHGANVDDLGTILTSGLLAGEVIGVGKNGQMPKSDSFPYNLDLLDTEGMQSGAGAPLDFDRSGGYGNIVLVVDRSEGSTDYRNEVEPVGEGHRLILGGVPSTEVRSIHVRPANEQDLKSVHDYGENLKQTINEVAVHGVYIPVFTGDGELALSYDQFKQIRQDGGYQTDFVKVEYIEPPWIAPVAAANRPLM